MAPGCPASRLCMRAPSSVIRRRDPSGLCFENVCWSNTFDSTALNHLLTVFISWSFLFYNSQLLLYMGGKELQVHREQEEAFANVIFVFYICKKNPIDF